MSRHDKVEHAIQKEVSTIIHEEMKDPRLGFVTITRVELTMDLRSAKIFFSVLGKEQEYKKTQEALECALGFIRNQIAQRIKLRYVPEIMFRRDDSAAYSVRIQEILQEIKEKDDSEKTDSGHQGK